MDLRQRFATNLRRIRNVGLEIVGKLAEVLEVDPIEFFRRPARSGSRRKAE